MSRSTDLRVEDLLAAAFSFGLVGFVAVRSELDHLTLGESELWDLSFLLFPVSLLFLLASARWAFRPESGAPPGGLRRAGAVIRDWFPFVFFSVTYEAFRGGVWTQVFTADRDAELLRLDRALFGETPAVLVERFTRPGLTAVMAWIYFIHLVLPPLLGLYLYARNRAVFRPFLLAVVLCGSIGTMLYVLVPAAGPRFAFPELFHVPLGGEPMAALIDAARAPRDAFPSLHAAVSALVAVYAWRAGRTPGLLLTPLVAGIWLSTIYLRYHYVVDLIAGGVLAGLVVFVAGALLRLEQRWRRGPAAAAA